MSKILSLTLSIVLLITACNKRQAVIKHCVPIGYAGSLFTLYSPDGKFPFVSGDTLYIQYDSNGVSHLNNQTFEGRYKDTDSVKDVYMYVDRQNDLAEIKNHYAYGRGLCHLNTFYSVHIVSNKDLFLPPEQFKPHIDSLIDVLCEH